MKFGTCERFGGVGICERGREKNGRMCEGCDSLLDLTKRKTTTHETCKSNICPAKEICWKSSVVYMATCTLCKDRYIGMTARRLHDRALEHLRATKNGSSSSALGDHYAKKHEGKPASVTFSILKHVHNHDVLRLHIEGGHRHKEVLSRT